jgi:hypothetical protein
MFSCAAHKTELENRLQTVEAILETTQAVRDILEESGAPNSAPGLTDISREARGIGIVLLYAAYENLMTSLCRSLLEAAIQLRVGNRRLHPGLQVFAVFNKLQAINAVTAPKIWRGLGLDVVTTITDSRYCTISADVFPNDGTHMKRSQVDTFCRVFDLGDPAPVLREVWGRLDSIVSERNQIAHGQLTADEIGRNYSIGELLELVQLWRDRWGSFLEWVESKASTRDFFRTRR